MGAIMNEPDSRVKLALIRAISKTLEEMAFEQVDLINDEDTIRAYDSSQSGLATAASSDSCQLNSFLKDRGSSVPCNEKLWAELPLVEPWFGEIAIEVGGECAVVLKESLFGATDESSPNEIVHDALAEILNTIAGCFMNELIPPDQEYQIGFPKTGQGSYVCLKSGAIRLYFRVGRHIMKAVISGGNPQTAATDHLCQREVSL